MCICIHLGISQSKMRDTLPFSLHDELKKHLFQGKKERKHIVADPTLFQVVFCCFQNFEVSVIFEQAQPSVYALQCLTGICINKTTKAKNANDAKL